MALKRRPTKWREVEHPYLIIYFYSKTYDYTDYSRSIFTLRFHEKDEMLNQALQTDRINRTELYSKGQCSRKMNTITKNIDKCNRIGKRIRELITKKGRLKGSERAFFANGHMRLGKLFQTKQHKRYALDIKKLENNSQLFY